MGIRSGKANAREIRVEIQENVATVGLPIQGIARVSLFFILPRMACRRRQATSASRGLSKAEAAEGRRVMEEASCGKRRLTRCHRLPF